MYITDLYSLSFCLAHRCSPIVCASVRACVCVDTELCAVGGNQFYMLILQSSFQERGFGKIASLCVLCGEALDSGGKTVVPTIEEETPSTEQAKRVHGHTVVVSEGETPSTEQAESVAIHLLCQRVRGHTKNAVALHPKLPEKKTRN